jgi:transcriptional regulator GlxA family with amidase domain
MSSQNHPSPESLVRAAVAAIHRAVRAGLAAPSLAALAAAAGVSGRTLQRHFIDVLGKPLRSVVADVRLQRALLLVQTTRMPLTAVATATGFGSQSRMNELFRRTLGRSPGAFRAEGSPSTGRPRGIKASAGTSRDAGS